MLTRLWRSLLACGLSMAPPIAARQNPARAQALDNRGTTVAEIRFGVVEPPVVAQRDVTVRAPISNLQREEKALECSGIAWVDDTLLIASDRHHHIVFACPVDVQRMALGEPMPLVVVRNEQEVLEDIECIATARDARGALWVYMMSSLSNDPDELPLPKRRHAVRFRLRNSEALAVRRTVVLNAGRIRDSINDYFDILGIEPYRTFNPAFSGPDKNTYRWGNIEGMAFAPDGSSLLLGMRNPLFGDDALMVVVQGVTPAFNSKDPDRLEMVDMFAVDLGGRGISDLCWDPLTKGYLIAAAKSSGPKLNKDQPFPPNTLDSALFWWSGHKQEKPLLFATLPDMKVEAVCRLVPTRFIAVGSDEGDVSEGRVQQQQSVITILYFTGID